VLADLAVLVVAQRGDPHADAVESKLAAQGVPFARTSLDVWSSQTVEWSSDGTLRLGIEEGATWSIRRDTTVWWRRPGWFENPLLGPDELDLARDETALMLPGALEAAGVKWVDQPWRTARARNRLVQLALAASLGIPVPATLVTNSPAAASQFLMSGPAVAKSISTGSGLAPFVDAVDSSELGLVANAPTFLQRTIKAEADWRVVTIGSKSFGWRRPRLSNGPTDWRAVDPAGMDFRHVPLSPPLGEMAISVQGRLGLSFSVQDWLQGVGAWYFLEVNPQGQWLFLQEADPIVSRALALHLAQGGP
jgi:hypothetical protein